MPIHQITSLSNASLDFYPNNTLTKFIHQLPIPIELNQSQKHTIELRSISLAFNVKSNVDQVNFVKLHLDELDPHIAAHEEDARCLARIPFSSSNASKNGAKITLWHEFTHPLAVPLANVIRLDRLSYLLTDEYNQQLDLESGITTVVNILIREMKYQDHFSITLNPSVSKDAFPRNEDNDYFTTFPDEIELGSGWEVALHSVMVPRGIHVEPMYEIRIASDWGEESVSWIIRDISDVEFFEALSDKLVTWGLGFEYDYADEESVIRITTPEETHEYCSLHFNGAVYEFFGKQPTLERVCFDFETYLSVEHIAINRKRKSIVDRENSRIDHIVIYCDILSDSIIGNTFSPLLDIISCNSVGLTKPKDNTLYHAPNLTFRPVSKEEFSTIRLMMHTLDGKAAPISVGSQNISITLYFRQHHE